MSKKSEFITIDSVPLRVDSYGGILPSDVETNLKNLPSEIILVFPGNPGVLAFYDDFLIRLHEKTKKCIWILSHSGQDREIYISSPSQTNRDFFSLQDHVHHKIQFIQKYLRDVKLFFIGHSIGCKMILEVLKTEGIKVEKCYFLFPTIERMAESRNGQIFCFFYRYFLNLILFTAFIFIHLPLYLRVTLLKLYFWLSCIPAKNIPAVLELIHPQVLQQCLFLANDEMKHVRELDHTTLHRFANVIKLYYGTSDGWVPLTYYENLKKNHKGIDAEIGTQGFEHAFVLKDSFPVADLVSEWIMGN